MTGTMQYFKSESVSLVKENRFKLGLHICILNYLNLKLVSDVISKIEALCFRIGRGLPRGLIQKFTKVVFALRYYI